MRAVAVIIHWATAAAAMLLLTAQAAAQHDFGTLMGEIADRDRLAVHPDGAYSQHQASSYDRGATPLGAPSSFANADTANFIRTAIINGQPEYVMMEDSGPGAITRWWMTGSSGTNGDIRVYIDGSTTPVLNGQFHSLSNRDALFGSSLSFQSRPGIDSGHNLYAPIPYNSSILVTYRGTVNDRPGWDPPVYYNINYRKFAEGTNVASYSAADPAAHSAAVTSTNQALANPGVQGSVTNTYAVMGQVLSAGQSLSHDLQGTRAIRRLAVKVDGANLEAALRNTYVELEFDGQRTARVPLGHFFGNGASCDSQALNPGWDYYRRVSASGEMSSYWTMPFETAAKVRLVNRGAGDVRVDLAIDSGDWQWSGDSMHFHADYREEKLIPTRGFNGTTDWTMVNVRGRGVFVGDTLSVRNRTGAWWGEGDEKFYVDYIGADGAGHNVQPVHIGTGTEDYYGYAWGHVETFSRPFITQPTGQGNASPGVSVNTRVRALDTIPFDETFKYDMEIWNWADTKLDFGGASFWYGTPGSKSLRLAADLGADYRAGVDQQSHAIPDQAGDGQWVYLSSSTSNPSAANAETSPLEFGAIGNAGNSGYGGGENGHNLPAISERFIFEDGGDNIGIQGRPGYHELALHPAGTADGNFGGFAEQPYVAARWVAGASSAGLANITGSIRNLVPNSDSVDFRIFVDGVERFTAFGSGTTLEESHFDFDAAIVEGSVVDFVLGNGPGSNLFGDESLLRAMIFADVEEFLPVEGDLNGDTQITPADWALLRDNFNSTFGMLSRQAAFGYGDLNGDLRNDYLDLGMFRDLYDAAHGAGAFAAMSTVPEPAAAWLAMFSTTLLWRLGPKRLIRPHDCRVASFAVTLDDNYPFSEQPEHGGENGSAP